LLSQQFDLLDVLIKISDQGMSQLHLISEAPNAVVISSGHHHDFGSFSSTQEVVVQQMLHSFTHFMSQNSQSFSGYLSHAYLECTPQCGSLGHLADLVNTCHTPVLGN
jgi:hypothetical protein